MKLNRTHLFISVLLIFWIVDLCSKLSYNGLVYGLDYGLFHPDGKLYTFRTLNFLGHSQTDAGNIVSNWYSIHAYKLNRFSSESLFYNVNPLWDLYKPRILYPLLSAPFVALIGVNGMLVIPALSMLMVMLVIFLIGNHLKNPLPGLVLATLISFSETINRWMFANTTDSLLTGLTSLFVLILVKKGQNNKFVFYSFPLIILTSLTRVAVFQWLAISAVLFISRQKKYSVYVSSIAILMFLPTLFKNASTAILPNEQNGNLIVKFRQFIFSLAKTAFYELAQLAVLDRLLLSLLLITIAISLTNMGRLSSKYFLAVLISLWVTGAINGTIGVNFRYQLPVIAFMGWSLIDNYSTFTRLWIIKNNSRFSIN
jgi:hypothetical protein